MACRENSKSTDKLPTEEKVVDKNNFPSFTISKAKTEDFNNAKKSFIDKTVYDTIAFKKVNGEIKLPINEKWKPFVIFKDTLVNTDDSDIKEYYYAGQFEKIGFYIVGGIFWEHSEYYLINKRTGRQTTIWSSPTISPKNKFIANLSMAYGLEGEPNGIQIWRVDRQKNNQTEPISLSKHIEIDQQIWAPDDFVWETDHSILLKVALVEDYMNENGRPNDSDFYFLRLKFQ